MNSQKVIITLNFITVVCSIISLVLLFNGGVDFKNPIIWILLLLLISSVATLITQYSSKNKKK